MEQHKHLVHYLCEQSVWLVCILLYIGSIEIEMDSLGVATKMGYGSIEIEIGK